MPSHDSSAGVPDLPVPADSQDERTPARAGSSRGDEARPWSAPRLTAYGDVRQLTRALLTPKGTNDGMTIGAMNLKTGGL
ncbi:MAG: hypothetical protein AAF725_12520 [Acidobacteriota bacterium]